MKGKKGGVSGAAMKAVGRNMARAENQKGSSSAPKKYAGGGQVRGTGAAVKGTKFEGTC